MKIHHSIIMIFVLDFFSVAVLAAVKPIVEVSGSINADMNMTVDNDYMITGEVHVASGVTLTIEDNVNVLIRNGNQKKIVGKTFAKKSGLIFDTGSSLVAGNLFFKACDDVGNIVSSSDNAGVFFMGSSSLWQQGQIVSNFSVKNSSFVAESIHLDYLGRMEPEINRLSPIYPALNVIGMNIYEWKVNNVISRNAASYGVRIDRSVVTLKSLEVKNFSKSGLRLFDSRLDVIKNLSINNDISNPRTQLFDLGQIKRIEKGPSRIRIFPNAIVNVDGLANAWFSVLSEDMPQRKVGVATSEYNFSGVLGSNQSYIYSTNISSY